MHLSALLDPSELVPWNGKTKIPWNDPAFSERMLREHLSQAHGHASRRSSVIDAQVQWIHQALCGGASLEILDLGCGPGLHTHALASLGHRTTGIDFSPAAIRHARSCAAQAGVDCTYWELDLCSAELGGPYDLILMLFGEFDTFAPDQAASLLARARRALRPGGALLLEVHTYEAVTALGQTASTWFRSDGGLLHPGPHLGLRETHWHELAKASTERTWVLPLDDPDGLSSLVSTTQARTEANHVALMARSGFARVQRHPSVGELPSPGFYAWVAR
jgi:SAM-dependent methyltransferase